MQRGGLRIRVLPGLKSHARVYIDQTLDKTRHRRTGGGGAHKSGNRIYEGSFRQILELPLS